VGLGFCFCCLFWFVFFFKKGNIFLKISLIFQIKSKAFVQKYLGALSASVLPIKGRNHLCFTLEKCAVKFK